MEPQNLGAMSSRQGSSPQSPVACLSAPRVSAASPPSPVVSQGEKLGQADDPSTTGGTKELDAS